MSTHLYACVHAAEFPSQALLRLRPDLQSLPVAVLAGRAPLEQVCSMNRLARLQGAAIGMTRLEAEALASQNGGLRLLPRSLESEAAARAVLLECAANFSPRIEDAKSDQARERHVSLCWILPAPSVCLDRLARWPNGCAARSRPPAFALQSRSAPTSIRHACWPQRRAESRWSPLAKKRRRCPTCQ